MSTPAPGGCQATDTGTVPWFHHRQSLELVAIVLLGAAKKVDFEHGSR